MTWQLAVVIVVEILAVAFLVYQVVGRRGPKRPTKPDVSVDDLVRRDRPDRD